MSRWIALCVGLVLTATTARAQDAEAIARGKRALETRAFNPSAWTVEAYENAWKHWQPKIEMAPANYDQAFRAYYGLHAAPYENGRYPMGLRSGPQGQGLALDCLICHGGSLFGKSYVGLGNAALDLQALLEDLNAASGRREKLPFNVTNVRGTNEAFGLTEFLVAFRNPDLSLRKEPLARKIADDVCEDVPAWWHLQKKRTMYHTGSTSARSVRSLMQFMLDQRNQLAAFEKEETVFRDIQAYLLSLRPPRYPFAINQQLAAQGQELFGQHCAKCHGTYGANGTYPNKIVAQEVVGTDATRLSSLSSRYFDFYNQSWFAKEKPAGSKATEAEGYQAPPLDGVWATAPYLHNGSVPTLHDMLSSKTRPRVFTRSYVTDEAAYDKVKVGWKVEVLRETPQNLSAQERRRIYDTTQPGRGNGGHTFGDAFSEEERRAIIEYLKTL
jgi:mono/diheme cytochrome c family protein